MTDQPAASNQSREWFVRRGEKEHGPFTSNQLRAMAVSGKIRADDFLRKNESSKWIKAESVKGLFASPDKPDEAIEVRQAHSSETNGIEAKTPKMNVTRKVAYGCAGAFLLFVVMCGGLIRLGSMARERGQQAVQQAERNSTTVVGTSGRQMTLNGEWVVIEEGDPVRIRLEHELSEADVPSGRPAIQRYVSQQLGLVGVNATCFIPADEWKKVGDRQVIRVTGNGRETDEPIGPLVLSDCRIEPEPRPNPQVSQNDLEYFRGYRSGVDTGLSKKRQYNRETDPKIRLMMEDEVSQLVLDYHRQAQRAGSAGGQADRLAGIGDGLRSGFFDSK